MRRLGVTVPMALCVIVGVLFMNFGRWPPTLTILMLLPVAVLGAISGLRLLHVNFSVSSAVGCIALVGQVVLSGVIECTQYLRALAATHDRRQALLRGAREAFRPVMLTTMLALLGLVPAALAHGMGSETQRPFAIAIVFGLIASLPAVMIVAPILFSMVVRRSDDGDAQRHVKPPDGPDGTVFLIRKGVER